MTEQTAEINPSPEQMATMMARIRYIAGLKTCLELDDDYSPSQDGSYDTAFNDGVDCGEIWFARHLLDIMK